MSQFYNPLNNVREQVSMTFQFIRVWYLSHMRANKAQSSLHRRAASPEPSLLAYEQYGGRRSYPTRLGAVRLIEKYIHRLFNVIFRKLSWNCLKPNDRQKKQREDRCLPCPPPPPFHEGLSQTLSPLDS